MRYKDFRIKEIFIVENSKPLHKVNLKISETNGLPYISRTKFSNGLEDIVADIYDGYKNPENTITFGAESVCFFYQPFEYYTGNKMYYLKRLDNGLINENIGLFLTTMIRISLKNTGYGYGMGLTGTRFKERIIKLPVDENDKPNWHYMEEYIKLKTKEVKSLYKPNYIHEITDFRELSDVEWREYFLDELFSIKSGVRLTKDNQVEGEIPFIGASDSNNGITGFINNVNSSTDSNILGVNYNGSVGFSFYHPYSATFSDDVKRLKLKENRKNNKYILLFFKHIIERQANKFAYGYKFNSQRMKRQIILLPTVCGEPDYNFMEQYMKRLENRILRKIGIDKWK